MLLNSSWNYWKKKIYYECTRPNMKKKDKKEGNKMSFQKGDKIEKLTINDRLYENVTIATAENGFLSFQYGGFMRIFDCEKIDCKII